MTVLRDFGNWLYRRDLGLELSWASWIDLYIFACEYLVDQLASETIHQMRSKQKTKRWVPNINEIEQIYDKTAEKSPLRELVILCFLNNVTPDRKFILKSAPEAFVREYAITAASNTDLELRNIQMQFRYSSGEHCNLGWIRLDSILRFQLRDSKEPGFLHSNLICGDSEYCDNTLYHVVGSQPFLKSTFKVFASWLYFEDDLGHEKHSCQQCSSLECLLDCYEASFALSRSKAVEIRQGKDNDGIANEPLSNRLQFKAIEFRDCLVQAAVVHCQRRDAVPALDEITRVYSFTQPGEPLRRVIVNAYICKGKSRITDIAHDGFQRQLNDTLLERLVESHQYIDQVRRIVHGIQNMRLSSNKKDMSDQCIHLRWKLLRIADIKVPDLAGVDADNTGDISTT